MIPNPISAAPPTRAERPREPVEFIYPLIEQLPDFNQPDWDVSLNKLDRHAVVLPSQLLDALLKLDPPARQRERLTAIHEKWRQQEATLTAAQLVPQLEWRLELLLYADTFCGAFSEWIIRHETHALLDRFHNDATLVAELERIRREYEPPSVDELMFVHEAVIGETNLLTLGEARAYYADARRFFKARCLSYIKRNLKSDANPTEAP